MGNFRKLRVWREAMNLAVDVDRVAGRTRGTRGAKWRDQITRAASSVPTNIVEGSAHESPREYARFLGYSISSVTEVEGHIELARELRMISELDSARLLNAVVEVRKMLHGLKKSIDPRDDPPSGKPDAADA